ncbi:MAG: DNA internalization-related competence protein ComEC/Rec2 [Bacteroidota bacterium]|nr:DNA internalization-related competence protein ComEC/Rec2 [Bacteroidota bacterium]
MIFLFLILISAFISFRKKPDSIFAFLFISIAVILFGILKSNIDFFFITDNSIKGIPDNIKVTNSRLTGIIKEIPDYDSNRVRFLLDAKFINDSIEVNGDVIVTIRKDIFSKSVVMQPHLNPGDKVTLTGKLSNAPAQRNPGEFNYKKYLALQNIHKTFLVTGYNNINIISKNNLGFFSQNIIYPAKIFALKNIKDNIKGDEGAYLKGLVTGERSDINPGMKDSFINAGVMHLIAVSGLNVAYIIIFVTLILSVLRIPVEIRIVITIFFLIFYCMFTGSSASIVRATIMGILVLIAFLIERKINFYNIIGTAAMIILIYDAKQLFDAGFILSFTATLSMVLVYSVFEKTFIIKIREWITRGKKLTLLIIALFFTSLAAQIGTLPITALYFEKISIVSIPANMIAVPLANLSLAIGFFQIVTATLSEYLSSVIAETNYILLMVQIEFIKWCASLDFSYITIHTFNFFNLICYYLILTILITTKKVKDILYRLILCIIIIAAAFIYGYDFSKNLSVTFLDVGQGDCALIQTADNKIILVDCGIITFTYNSGERTIAPYLHRNGIDKIDLLIVTHLHNDHIGGINYLLRNFKIGKIIESGQKVNTSFTYTMDSLIINKNISREIVRDGDLIDDIKDLRLYFLFPSDKFVNDQGLTEGNNLNNGSIAFILKYKDTEIFFGGDIEREAERFLYQTYSDFLKTDILKVSHHGSHSSTTIPFIIKNKPEFALISCGMFNRFNHPSDIVLNRLKNIGTIIYRTDLDGALIMESDGSNIFVKDWK